MKHLDYYQIKDIVAERMGLPDEPSARENRMLDSIIQRGYAQFMYPPPIEGRGAPGHQWSFLRPTIEIGCEADVGDYDLPAGFVSMLGNLTFTTDDDGYREVTEVGEGRIRAFRMRNNTVTTDYPTHFAVRIKPHEGTEHQKWELMLWPNPDASYDMHMQVELEPLDLSEDFPIPLGPAVHADTILESCLGLVEQTLEDGAGVHTQKWKERLIASIDIDNRSKPNGLGYNGNGPTEFTWHRTDRATYNGTLYD